MTSERYQTPETGADLARELLVKMDDEGRAEAQERGVPMARTTAEWYDDSVWLLRVDDCPLCGERHEHGGGNDPDPHLLVGMMGHRAAHCSDVDNGGYVLVPAKGLFILGGEAA